MATSAAAQFVPSSPIKPPALKAAAAILVDADTGQVLWEKNADKPRPPASTTKIMTAILLLENTQPDDLITASKAASETGGSSLNLKPAEQVTAHDMLYALMLRSANDGCVAVAEHIAGSEREFAKLMTAKATEIGATHSRFGNANGLNENPNVTTARDLSLMARYAFRFPEFNDAVHSKYAVIRRSTDSKDTVLKNHAKFLWKFPGADGVKTGYTNPAGHCFVGAATWNGWRLVSVVLGSPDIVQETSALMKYGFQRFEARAVVSPGQLFGDAQVRGGTAERVPVTAEAAIKLVSPRGTTPSVELRSVVKPAMAPIPAGAPLGTLEAWADGRMVGTTRLLSAAAVDRPVAAMSTTGYGGWTFAALLMGAVVIGYGTTAAKTARVRRYRLKALLRDVDRSGTRFR